PASPLLLDGLAGCTSLSGASSGWFSSGLAATALGLTATALGLTATALGLAATALGLAATALGLTATALGFIAGFAAIAVARSGVVASARAGAMSSAASGRGVAVSGIFSTITGGGSGRPNHTIAPPSGSPRKIPIAIPPSSGPRIERRFSARGVAMSTLAKCAAAAFGFGAVDCSSDHSTKYSIAPSLTSLNGLAGTVLPSAVCVGGSGAPGIGVRKRSAN